MSSDKDKCQECGAQCCRFLTFNIPGLSNNRLQKEYYKAHGCKVVKDTVIVPSKCEQLQDDNSCKIYDKRPYYCRAFKGKSKTDPKDKRFFIPEECLL